MASSCHGVCISCMLPEATAVHYWHYWQHYVTLTRPPSTKLPNALQQFPGVEVLAFSKTTFSNATTGLKTVVEMPGFEPGASYMRSKRSTAELHPQGVIEGSIKLAVLIEVFWFFVICTWKLSNHLHFQYLRICLEYTIQVLLKISKNKVEIVEQ